MLTFSDRRAKHQNPASFRQPRIFYGLFSPAFMASPGSVLETGLDAPLWLPLGSLEAVLDPDLFPDVVICQTYIHRDFL